MDGSLQYNVTHIYSHVTATLHSNTTHTHTHTMNANPLWFFDVSSSFAQHTIYICNTYTKRASLVSLLSPVFIKKSDSSSSTSSVQNEASGTLSRCFSSAERGVITALTKHWSFAGQSPGQGPSVDEALVSRYVTRAAHALSSDAAIHSTEALSAYTW